MLNSVATAAILYGISFAEGVRQLPADAIVLRRFAFGRWRYVRRVEIGAGLRLVSWCLPVSLPLVLPRASRPAGEAEIPERVSAMRARIAETSFSLALLRGLGLVTLLLVAGVPFVVERSGLFGLIVAVIVLLELMFVQALAVGWLLRRLGATGRSAAMTSLKLFNPFGVQRASEVIFARVVADMPAFVVAHELLGAEEFVRAFRPMLYDALHGEGAVEDVASLAPLLAEERVASLLRTAPPGLAGGAFCPRCASQFASDGGFCSECHDVPLLGAGSE